MSEISIIVPIYNAEKSIKRCLDSIKSQTFSNYEVLLINDGSTDNSAQICEEYCKKDIRFKLINQENSGPSASRNRGIDSAVSKYISFIDSDDYVEPNMLQEFYNAAEASQADLTMCSFITEFSDGHFRKYKSLKKPGVFQGEECKEIAIQAIDKWQCNIIPYSWIRFIKREIIEFPRLRFNTSVYRGEDYLFWVQVHFRVNSLCLITDKHLYHYVQNDNSITHKYIKDFWSMSKIIYDELKNVLPDEEKINKQLDLMLIQYSYVGMHISVLANDYKTFKSDIKNALYDKSFKRIIKTTSLKNLPNWHKKYFLPFKFRLRWVLRILYTYKYYIQHKQNFLNRSKD